MSRLKIITMSEIEPESINWLWEPYLPFGKIAIVQGDPCVNKTTMMLAIAADLTQGKALPNGIDAEPIDVIFQSAEDGMADTIKPRLEKLGADCSRVHVIDECEKSLSFSDERIEQAIVEKKAKLLVLDPIQAYLGKANINMAHGIRPQLKHLAEVAERTGCAIVLIGHLNKSAGKSQYRGLGSIDIYAAARSVLTVGKIDDNIRAVVQNKSNLAPPGAAMAFELDPFTGFRWLGEIDISIDDLVSGRTRPESKSEQAQKIIESMMGNGQLVASKEIIKAAEAAGLSSKTLNREKVKLGVKSIKMGNRWYWQMTIVVDYIDKQDGQ